MISITVSRSLDSAALEAQAVLKGVNPGEWFYQYDEDLGELQVFLNSAAATRLGVDVGGLQEFWNL